MPDYDAMVVLHGPSNLPEDRFVNTLHFSDSTPALSWDAGAEEIGEGIVAAWEAFTDGGASVYPNDTVARGFEVRLYNPDDAPPREPTVFPGTLPAGLTNALPTEVALCLSFYGERNLPRQRGRIYIGPLDQAANLDSRPTAGIIFSLMALGQDLSDVGGGSVDWQVVSTVGAARERVQNIWVDNAFDTQRRRGLAPTTRSEETTSG